MQTVSRITILVALFLAGCVKSEPAKGEPAMNMCGDDDYSDPPVIRSKP